MKWQGKVTRRGHPLGIFIWSIFLLSALFKDVTSSISAPADNGAINGHLVFYTSVCEGKTMDLKCPDGTVILIEHANFGRTDRETCLGFGRTDNTNCEAPHTFDIVSEMCDYKVSCSIRASSSVFP